MPRTSAAGRVQASTSGGSRDCSLPRGPGDLRLGTQVSTNPGFLVQAPTGSERLSLGLEPCGHLWPGAKTHRSPILRKPICKPAEREKSGGETRKGTAANQNHSTNRIYKPQMQRVLTPKAAPGQHRVTRPSWPRALPGQDKVGLCRGKLPEVGRPKAPVPHFPPVLQPVLALQRVCRPLLAICN